MSRIGKTPVPVPAGVEVKLDGDHVTVKGPKGQLELQLHDGISAEVGDKSVTLSADENRDVGAVHGLDRALLNNCVVGVSQGFTRKLEIVGTGYSAKLAGDKVELQIGFSHPVLIPIPQGLAVEVPQPMQIVITGIDKQAVGELAAVIRKVRKPEPYKGKGIRYENEQVRRKAGKTMGAAG